MIPEIGAWGINHTLNFNPNPGGNNCMTCSCSLPHVCRENVQASSSNHPDVPGTDTLAENLCGCSPWAVLPCSLEQEIPSELFCEWWDDMWKTALLLPTLYLCKHLWQAGNHLGSSKLKSKQTKITLCLWVNVWGVYTRPLHFRNHVPDVSADLALFTHSASDLGSDSGGVISFIK